MTQTNNRFFDEIGRLMNDAAGAAQGVKREVDAVVRNQAEKILRDLDIVKREEFEAVKDMARLAREENEALKARIAALEAKLGGRPAADRGSFAAMAKARRDLPVVAFKSQQAFDAWLRIATCGFARPVAENRQEILRDCSISQGRGGRYRALSWLDRRPARQFRRRVLADQLHAAASRPASGRRKIAPARWSL